MKLHKPSRLTVVLYCSCLGLVLATVFADLSWFIREFGFTGTFLGSLFSALIFYIPLRLLVFGVVRIRVFVKNNRKVKESG